MRSMSLAVAAIALIATTHTVHAQRGGGRGPGGGPGRGPGGGPGGMMRCAQTADSLTDVQKGQVKTLGDAYVAAHKPSLDSLRAIADASRTAREAGKTPEEVRAIMQLGMPINEALAPARKEFAEAAIKLLTPSQIAEGCIPQAPGGPMMGGRRGGPPRPPPEG
jgi:Spy/CpxP family protein refolding chaperone